MKPGYELNHRYKIIESLGEGGMALMRGIKSGIDPDHILCPGQLAMR